MRRLGILAAFMLAATAAAAQTAAPAAPPALITERTLSAALAAESAAVVNRAGVLGGDRVGPHIASEARPKAYAAASMRVATTRVLETVRTNPGAARLPDIEGFLIVGDGLPIRAGDEVVGAIGVGGAPGGRLDDQCAEAGIARIRDRLQ